MGRRFSVFTVNPLCHLCAKSVCVLVQCLNDSQATSMSTRLSIRHCNCTVSHYLSLSVWLTVYSCLSYVTGNPYMYYQPAILYVSHLLVTFASLSTSMSVTGSTSVTVAISLSVTSTHSSQMIRLYDGNCNIQKLSETDPSPPCC